MHQELKVLIDDKASKYSFDELENDMK